MAKSNETWVWLEEAAQEARQMIEQLYGEGCSKIGAGRIQDKRVLPASEDTTDSSDPDPGRPQHDRPVDALAEEPIEAPKGDVTT